jgi:predicted lipoprotein with Yx(FWY)xxD motif
VKLSLIAALVAVAGAALAPAAAPMQRKPLAPAIKLKSASFGNILATRGHKALYFWTEEKADHKIHCVGACATLWPPLIVRTASLVPKRVTGIRGTFGVIRRPDGRIQVTHNRLPAYTYAHEGPNQVLCDNVDGWFVVRL